MKIPSCNNSKSLVSILIPTYNRSKFLSECLDSVLSQDYKNLEIVIRDDCSQDDTASIVEKYKSFFNIGLNFKYIRNVTNIGYMQNMRDGLINDCTGKYAMVLNDDDFLGTDKIVSSFVTTLESSISISFVYSNVNVYREKSQKISPQEIIRENSSRKISFDHSIVDGNEYFSNLWTKFSPVCWAALIFRRQLAIERNWGKSDCRDQGIAHLLSVNQRVAIYHDKFAYYRVHDSTDIGIGNVVKRCTPEMAIASHKSIEVWIDCAEKMSDMSQFSLFIWRLKTVILKDNGPIRWLYDQNESKLQQFLVLVKKHNCLHYIVLKYLSPQMIAYDYHKASNCENTFVRFLLKVMIGIRWATSGLIIQTDRILHDPEYRHRFRIDKIFYDPEYRFRFRGYISRRIFGRSGSSHE